MNGDKLQSYDDDDDVSIKLWLIYGEENLIRIAV